MRLFSFLSFIVIIISCNQPAQQRSEDEMRDSALKLNIQRQISTIPKDSLLKKTTIEILDAAGKNDFAKLAEYIHPDSSLIFSPYGFVRKDRIQLTKADFIRVSNKDTLIKWGLYDGSGDTIKLTPKNYFAKFAYNRNYLSAEKLSINEKLSSGNSKDNLQEIFPNADFTESYFSGFDPKLNGLDWASLKLIFREHDGKYLLVGWINDRWTI